MGKSAGKTDWERVDAMTDEDITKAVANDSDEIPVNPEWTDELFSQATSVADSNLPESFKRTLLRGKQKAATKRATNIRLSENVIDFFKAGAKDGKGWQTRLSHALETYVKEHKSG